MTRQVTPARIFKVIASGRLVSWRVCHPALPRPLCIDAASPNRLDYNGARDFDIAWNALGEPFFLDLCAALVQQMGLSEEEAEDVANSWDTDSAQYARDQLDARIAGLIE